jgi:DNA polymerase III gamma/tau subunit
MVGSRKVLMDLGSAFASGNLRRAIAVLGPTGTGKTTLNMIIAKSVTCQTPGPDGRPCGTCASCQVFNEDEYKTKHPDIFVLNCSEKTGIDDIRATLQLARTYPLVGRHRVIFLDEAQGLSKQAEMALLKELEHPPAHTVILVGSMNPEQVSKAVLDRCYCIKLSTASDANGRASLAARLMHIAKAEGVEIQKDVALAIADISDGFQRNAVQTLDNVLNRIRSGQPIEIERLYDTIAEVASGSPFTLAKRALCAVYEGDVKAFIDAVSASENVLFMLRTMIQQSGEALRYSVDENSIQNVMAARTARDVVKSAVKSKLTAYQRAHVGRAFEDTLKLVSGYTVDAAAALVHTAVILDEQLKVQRK